MSSSVRLVSSDPPGAVSSPIASPIAHPFSFAPDFPLLLPPPTQISRTELVEAEDEDGLVDLEAQDLRLNERKRLAVDLDQTLALLGVGDSGGGLLLAEALDALNGRHDGGVVGVRVFWSVG